MPDNVHHPKHYNAHPSGVECITITEHMGFCLGNAIKYIWRADLKNGTEDLEKAAWYINREIQLRKKRGTPPSTGMREIHAHPGGKELEAEFPDGKVIPCRAGDILPEAAIIRPRTTQPQATRFWPIKRK